jgi:hypothetical protein
MWATVVAAALCVLAVSGTEVKAQRAYRGARHFPSYRYSYSPYSSSRYSGGYDYPQYNNGRSPYYYGYSPAASYYSSPYSSADGSGISSSSSVTSGVVDGRGWGSAGYLRR